jgi:DNA-binding NtrC family response regulator
VDVMVIAATNQDLSRLVKEGRFREDLYFRLNVISLWLPPLRERKDDIKPLAKFFLEKFNRERKKDLAFSDHSLQVLDSYDYPGNVRELRNIIEDAFVFCDGNKIEPENLLIMSSQNKLKQSPSKQYDNGHKIIQNLTHREAIEVFEKEYFKLLLREHLWNYKDAAKAADITREWLSKKIKLLELDKT